MFTGIVTERGTIVDAVERAGVLRLAINAPSTSEGLSVGDSIAVNGTCLTAVDTSLTGFEVEAVSETLARTTLGGVRAGDRVNLERPLRADGRLDGHIVQGHVDGVGEVVDMHEDEGSSLLRVSVPEDLSRYVVEKGSIAVDGVSLTVTAVSDSTSEAPWFEVAVIPHTRSVTSLGEIAPGSRVNIEVDPVAKYVERMLGARG